jgi:peptidoglycan/xylan/chitin deacetylase (PgdA/CDA1 family)
MTMLKPLKQIMLHSLKQTLAFRVLQDSPWRRRRLLILAYHGLSIDDEHEWNPSLFMTPTAFRERMRLLKQSGATVLPLAEAVRRLYADDLPPRSVVITFDDGFHNFYEHGYPILSEYGYPSTVYLTTFYSDYNKPIFLLSCSYLLWKGRHGVLERNDALGFQMSMDLRTSPGREVALKAIRECIARRDMNVEQQTRLLEELARCVHVDWKKFMASRVLHLMNHEAVAYVSSRGVNVEMHMHYHCSPDDRETYLRDVAENRHRIEDMTGSRPVHFCYPSGNHRPEVVSWLQEAGIVTATTCELGLASPMDHPLLLPRFLDHSGISLIEFESWVTGVGSFLSRQMGASGKQWSPVMEVSLAQP